MIEKPTRDDELRFNRLFIIGIDANGQPRGAKFAQANDFVAGAALDMGLTCIIPASERTAGLGKKLPEAQLYKTGKVFIPHISRALYDTFVDVLANPDQGTGLLKTELCQPSF